MSRFRVQQEHQAAPPSPHTDDEQTADTARATASEQSVQSHEPQQQIEPESQQMCASADDGGLEQAAASAETAPSWLEALTDLARDYTTSSSAQEAWWGPHPEHKEQAGAGHAVDARSVALQDQAVDDAAEQGVSGGIVQPAVSEVYSVVDHEPVEASAATAHRKPMTAATTAARPPVGVAWMPAVEEQSGDGESSVADSTADGAQGEASTSMGGTVERTASWMQSPAKAWISAARSQRKVEGPGISLQPAATAEHTRRAGSVIMAGTASPAARMFGSPAASSTVSSRVVARMGPAVSVTVSPAFVGYGYNDSMDAPEVAAEVSEPRSVEEARTVEAAAADVAGRGSVVRRQLWPEMEQAAAAEGGQQITTEPETEPEPRSVLPSTQNRQVHFSLPSAPSMLSTLPREAAPCNTARRGSVGSVGSVGSMSVASAHSEQRSGGLAAEEGEGRPVRGGYYPDATGVRSRGGDADDVFGSSTQVRSSGTRGHMLTSRVQGRKQTQAPVRPPTIPPHVGSGMGSGTRSGAVTASGRSPAGGRVVWQRSPRKMARTPPQPASAATHTVDETSQRVAGGGRASAVRTVSRTRLMGAVTDALDTQGRTASPPMPVARSLQYDFSQAAATTAGSDDASPKASRDAPPRPVAAPVRPAIASPAATTRRHAQTPTSPIRMTPESFDGTCTPHRHT